jgi:ribose transport system substrate-binding protein
VDLIAAGKMLASGDYNGFVQGCVATMIAIRSLRHEPVPPTVSQATVVIDKSNLAAYQVPVEQRSCPTWDSVAN